MKTTAEKTKVKLNHLLNPIGLNDDVEALMPVLPALKHTIDEKDRLELPELLEDPREKEELLVKFDLLSILLDKTNSIDDLGALVDDLYQAERERYEENMQNVFAQTKPFEKTVRSLSLLYQNATGDTNVYVMGVNKSRFADSSNPKHFEEFRHFLREKFYNWFMEDSPFYLTYVGDVGSKSAMDQLAMIAQETRALAVVDIKEMKNAKDVVEYAKKMKIAGIPVHLSHLVTLGTWVYAHNAFEVEFTRDANGQLRRVESQMAVPSACAFIGKMMSVPPGYYITGLEQSAIVGINGVKVAYDLQRIDAKEWDECGVIQIEPYGHIMGAATANKSNNRDLGKFPKVDIANALLKDLVQFCNDSAYSKWGDRQRREFKREIESYLNNRIRHELIQGYSIDKIEYNQGDENVEIDITIHFYEIADEFDINLHGPKGMIDFKKEENKNS